MKLDKDHEIKITPSAITRIKTMTAEGEFKGMIFRVEVLGGGCSGFQYNFSFENELSYFTSCSFTKKLTFIKLTSEVFTFYRKLF